jgi:hypothetical protein
MAERPCAVCGKEIGNPVFTVCDECWPLQGPKMARPRVEKRGECTEADTPARVLTTDAERCSWLRTGLTMVLDLPSDTSDLEILVAVASARSAEVQANTWLCSCGNEVMGPRCTVCHSTPRSTTSWRVDRSNAIGHGQCFSIQNGALQGIGHIPIPVDVLRAMLDHYDSDPEAPR